MGSSLQNQTFTKLKTKDRLWVGSCRSGSQSQQAALEGSVDPHRADTPPHPAPTPSLARWSAHHARCAENNARCSLAEQNEAA